MIPRAYIIHATTTTYKINTTIHGEGIITLTPQQTSYYPGTIITLQAIPQPEWLFSHWTGDLTGTNTNQTIQMNQNKTIHAHFIINDTTPPHIQIKNPQQGIYLHNRLIHRFRLNRKSIIIGSLQIEIITNDTQTPIDYIELYINGKLTHREESTNLSYYWTEKRFRLFNHQHIITIIACDENGNTASDRLIVLKFR